MPDPSTIPFKQADPNGHYRSKQLPNDSGDFMSMLGLPAIAGDVIGPGGTTPGQATIFSDATGKRIDAATQTGLAKLSGGVLSAVAAPVGAVVGTTDVQTLTNKTLINPTLEGVTGFDKDDVGLGNVDNTSDATKPVSGPQQAALDLKEDKNKKGVANGYASLDAATKVPLEQIPDSVLGGQQYQGTWNAATNTPAIPTATILNKGWYYSVAVAGTTNINGVSSWAVGDEIISNGSVWQKIVNVSAVNSVNGYTGVVVLGKADVGLGNVDNTSDANKPVSSATVTQLNLKEDKANKNVANGYAGLDATGKVPAANVPADLVTSVAAKQGVVTLVKGDVGLGNVDNTSDATKNSASATLTNKTINGANNTLTVRLASDVTGNLPVTNLNAGTGANSGSFWRGDGQWAPPAGGGDVIGPAGSVDGEVVSFNSTTGKVIKASGGKLAANLVAGPASATSGRIASYGDTTGKLIADGGKLAADLVTGPAASVDGEMALYSGTTGKVLKRATGTGFTHVTSGVAGTPTAKVIVGDSTTSGYPTGTVVVPSFVAHPDKVIASPNAFDDHFEGSSLNAKWTVVQTPDSVWHSVAVAGSYAYLSSRSQTGDSATCYVDFGQTLLNANNFTLTFKANHQRLIHSVTGSYASLEVSLFSVSTVYGLAIKFESVYSPGVGAIVVVSQYTGLNLGTSFASFYGVMEAPYFRFVWNRSALTVSPEMSLNGITWTPMQFAAAFNSALTGLSESNLPTNFSLTIRTTNFGQSEASVDWVKFTNF